MDPRPSFPVYIVDTFTRIDNNGELTGNPAAVCILPCINEINEARMQAIAAELNQSVTAFVSHRSSSGQTSAWVTRWFSAKTELTLCGHATLAAAKVIFSQDAKLTSLTFEGKCDLRLKSTKNSETLITLRLASCPVQNMPYATYSWIPALVQATLGTEAVSRVSVEPLYSLAGQKILIRVKATDGSDAETLIRMVSPDLQTMMKIVPASLNLVGVGVTIENPEAAGGLPTFFSRFFAPWVGLDEDEVCGSLHAMLTPYWSTELGLGQETMLSRFVSNRTGDVLVKLEDDMVTIMGNAVITMEGKFLS